MIPSPKKIRIGDNTVHCSVFNSGISLTLSATVYKKRIHDGSIVLPPVFIAKCKDFIQKHTEQICSWFNPSPSPNTIANVTYLPSTIPYDEKKLSSSKEVTIRVNGIIVESHRILPHITLDFVPEETQNLMESLAIGNTDDDIEDITDDIIVRDIEDTEDDDDEDNETEEETEGESDEDEDEDDDDDRFARVQRSLDEAREELERLRRERNRG